MKECQILMWHSCDERTSATWFFNHSWLGSTKQAPMFGQGLYFSILRMYTQNHYEIFEDDSVSDLTLECMYKNLGSSWFFIRQSSNFFASHLSSLSSPHTLSLLETHIRLLHKNNLIPLHPFPCCCFCHRNSLCNFYTWNRIYYQCYEPWPSPRCCPWYCNILKRGQNEGVDGSTGLNNRDLTPGGIGGVVPVAYVASLDPRLQPWPYSRWCCSRRPILKASSLILRWYSSCQRMSVNDRFAFVIIKLNKSPFSPRWTVISLFKLVCLISIIIIFNEIVFEAKWYHWRSC